MSTVIHDIDIIRPSYAYYQLEFFVAQTKPTDADEDSDLERDEASCHKLPQTAYQNREAGIRAVNTIAGIIADSNLNGEPLGAVMEEPLNGQESRVSEPNINTNTKDMGPHKTFTIGWATKNKVNPSSPNE